MSIENPIVMVALEEITIEVLAALAQQENKSISSLAKELILEALEQREDKVLSATAEVRDTPDAKKISIMTFGNKHYYT